MRRGARRLDCHDHENFSPVTFNFRAVGKSPPLELGHRPADSRPPPSSRDSTLPRTTALLSRPHSPPPPSKLSSRIYVASSRSNFRTRAYATFFLSFRSRAHEGEEEIVKRERRSLPLHVSSRRRQLTHDNLLHFHSSAESLNFVINGRRKVGWYTTKRSEGFSLVYRSIDTDYCIDRAWSSLTDRAPRQLVPV